MILSLKSIYTIAPYYNAIFLIWNMFYHKYTPWFFIFMSA